MKNIDNTDSSGNMNHDYADFFLHGEKIAEVKNPHAGIAVGENVRIDGKVYNVEKAIQDIEEFSTEYYLSSAEEPIPLLNGRVYLDGLSTFVLVYVGNDLWAMLYIDPHIKKGMSAPSFQHNKKGGFLFTEKDLQEQCNSDSWKALDGKLIIEKQGGSNGTSRKIYKSM